MIMSSSYTPLDKHRSIERFHRTLTAEWAFARHYPNELTRRSALPAWLHTYNHHQQHSAIGKVPPITRLTNLPGHYI
jgi:transposase InsO family protein